MSIHDEFASPYSHNLNVTYHTIDRFPALRTTRQTLGQVLITLKKLPMMFLERLVGSSDPQIVQKRDRKGQIFWNVYDPVTDYIGRFNSEVEVRSWIEQRYSSTLIIKRRHWK